MRVKPWWVVALVVLALLLTLRVSGWSPSAPEPLPLTTYEPTRSEHPANAQTLANGTFDAAGGVFAWEVHGFPRMTSTGVHSFQYRVHRVGGESARIWPEAVLMLDGRGDNLGEGDLVAPPSVEQGVLVVRQGFQPRGPGVYEMTAVLRLDVARDVAVGYLWQDPVEVRLPFRTESAPFGAPGSGAPS